MAFGAILGQSFETSPVLDNYFTKDETLTSSTAALFGLGADSVPDDAFAYLGKYASKIATGSYVGTGKYGSSNPNSLTLDFEPKIMFIQYGGTLGFCYRTAYFPVFAYGNGYFQRAFLRIEGDGITSPDADDFFAKTDGKTVYWYADDAGSQMNNSGEKFLYIIVG